MIHWNDESDDAPEAWRPDGACAELTFGDPDAWRGGAGADPDAWRTGATHPRREAAAHLDPARPDILEHGWPAADVGPEYLMWKSRKDEE